MIKHDPYGNLFGKKEVTINTPSVYDETMEVRNEDATYSKVDPNDLKDKSTDVTPSQVLFDMSPERREDETFEQYKERRRDNNHYVKLFLKRGSVVWDSRKQGTRVVR